ncbi:MAG TPA: vWA domain-containing protein [Streptosporangiaceae bacterium]
MTYQAEISRANPSCFIFLVDQSASMVDPIGGSGGVTARKHEVVADALNRLLTEIAIKCAKEEGVRDYFHVAVIGYGARSAAPALGGDLAGRRLVPISELADHPLRLEERVKKEPDGAGGLVEVTTQFPVWIEPVANGATPMCQALAEAKALVAEWITQHPRGFPPIVLNLTDGEANDGDPVAVADELRLLGTDDGEALLFNLHVSDAGGSPVTFPDSDAGLPDAYARTLFAMSSELPPHMQSYARQNGYPIGETAHGFVYNADVVSLVQFLDIGTRALALR